MPVVGLIPIFGASPTPCRGTLVPPWLAVTTSDAVSLVAVLGVNVTVTVHALAVCGGIPCARPAHVFAVILKSAFPVTVMMGVLDAVPPLLETENWRVVGVPTFTDAKFPAGETDNDAPVTPVPLKNAEPLCPLAVALGQSRGFRGLGRGIEAHHDSAGAAPFAASVLPLHPSDVTAKSLWFAPASARRRYGGSGCHAAGVGHREGRGGRAPRCP